MFQRYEIFAAIVPFHGQFVSDVLNVLRVHQRFAKNFLKAARLSELTWCSMPSASSSAVFSEIPNERRNATTVS